MITLVAAIGPRGEIGLQGKLPWSLAGDLARFRRETVGRHVIMGRRTFESIGHALPGRTNIVVTSHEMSIPGLIVASSFRQAMYIVGSVDACVIGGVGIFTEALPYCSYAALSLLENRSTQTPFSRWRPSTTWAGTPWPAGQSKAGTESWSGSPRTQRTRSSCPTLQIAPIHRYQHDRPREVHHDVPLLRHERLPG